MAYTCTFSLFSVDFQIVFMFMRAQWRDTITILCKNFVVFFSPLHTYNVGKDVRLSLNALMLTKQSIQSMIKAKACQPKYAFGTECGANKKMQIGIEESAQSIIQEMPNPFRGLSSIVRSIFRLFIHRYCITKFIWIHNEKFSWNSRWIDISKIPCCEEASK